MKKALIVDDLEQNVYLLRSILEGDGFEVICARNGAEALELARSNPPDIVISDILMPTMDGFTLLREWKKDAALHNIPLIIYTATYTDPRDEELALRLGAARFIVKPVEPEVFTDSVRQVMEADHARHIPSPPDLIDDETVYYRMYNETLIRKLEHKMLALEQEITKSRQDEEILWWKEEKYRTLFEGMSQGAFYQAADGRLIDVNPAALRIFGLTRQEFLARNSHSSAWDVIREDGSKVPPNDHPSMAAVTTGNPVKDVTIGVFNSIKNTYVWVIVNAIPQYRRGESSPFQVYVTLHDITERKQWEKERLLMGEVLSASLNEIYIFDAETLKFQYVNYGALHNLGYSLEEMQNLTPLDLKPELSPEAFDQLIQPLISGLLPVLFFETLHRRADGSLYPVEVHLQYFRRPEQNVFFAVILDITKRKQAEEALKSSEYRQKAILNNIPDIAWLKDIEGKYIAVNEAYALSAGYDTEAIVGKTDRDLWSPEMAAQYREDDLQVMQSRQRSVFEEHLVSHEGRATLMESIKTPLFDDRGTIIGTAGIARDITERKKMEESLQQASEKWRSTFDAMLDPVALLDAEGGIEQCNRSFIDFLNLDFQAVLGRKCHQLIHHTEDHIPGCPIIKSRESGVRETMVLQGGEKFFLVVADPIKAPDGKITGFVHIMRDITERKLAEAALKLELEERRRVEAELLETEVLLTEAQQIAHVGTWTFNSETGQFRWSDEIYSILGLPVGSLKLFSDFTRCIHPEDHRILAQAWNNMLDEKDSAEFEYRIVRPSGEIRCIHEYSIYRYNGVSQVASAASLLHDITERKTAEEALQELNLAIEQSKDGIAFADLDGHIRFANEAWAQMHGYSVDELIGQHLRIFHTPEQLEHEVIPFNEYALTNGSQSGEVGHVRKDGTIFPSWMSSTAVVKGGKPSGWLGIARDITDRKAAEATLQAKNTELERFTYSVSHDLRSPLVTIRTFMGHLAEDMAQGDRDRVTADMGYINTASQKMVELLDELLQLSRIGRMANPSVLAPLQDIVQEALALVAGRIDERGVRVTVTENSVLLYGDRVRLVEVFQNLVDNAVKFMGEQKVPLIEIGTENKNGGILCFVRDNGMGIEPRHRDRLFGLFEKLDTASEGTGMGLALVKRIVEVHGGRIWVESDGPGKGACFWFSLPRKSSES